jgi:hypothetical protein
MHQLVKVMKELWQGIDDFQRYSLLAILGLGGLLVVLMMIFGLWDVIKSFLPDQG